MPATPRELARRGERRARLARARDRLIAEDQARRDAQRAKVEAWEAGTAARAPRSGKRPDDQPRANRAGTEPRANLTDPDVRVMRNKKGYVSGYNGQLVVTEARRSSARCSANIRSTAPCYTRCSTPAGSS